MLMRKVRLSCQLAWQRSALLATDMHFHSRPLTLGPSDPSSFSSTAGSDGSGGGGRGFGRGRGGGGFRGRARGGGAPPSGRPQHEGGSGHKSLRGPVKDRYPPVSTDLSDPRRRLAVLIDATNTNLLSSSSSAGSRSALDWNSPFFSTVLPEVLKVGTPVLLRVFAHQLPSEWEALIAGGGGGATATTSSSSGGSAAQGGSSGAPHTVQVSPRTGATNEERAAAAAAPQMAQAEFFRVERFIPIPMQIEADAQHLFDFREHNKIEGVCYVCSEIDRSMYESLMREQVGGSAAVGSRNQANAAAFFNQYLVDELGMVKEVVVDGRSADGS